MCNESKQTPNARQSKEGSISGASETPSMNKSKTPSFNKQDSTREVQIMFRRDYYTPCLKDKRFWALLIETIFWLIALVSLIGFLLGANHG